MAITKPRPQTPSDSFLNEDRAIVVLGRQIVTSRLVRILVFLLACSSLQPHARAASEPTQPAPVVAEPSGPKASAPVDNMLAEVSRLAEAKQPLDSLKTAD